MKKIIRKKIAFFAFILCLALHVSAQDLKFEILVNKSGEEKVIIRNSNNSSSPAFELFIEVADNQRTNSIELTLKRGNNGQDFFLCYSLVKNIALIKEMRECTSNKPKLRRKGEVKDKIKQLEYFIKSGDLMLPDKDCYGQLACNNFDEFILPVVTPEQPISLTLQFYVAQNLKKSKRPTLLLYTVDPINIEITVTRDSCSESEDISAEINVQIRKLDVLQKNAQEAVKEEQTCQERLGNINQRVQTEFHYEHPQWEKFKKCPEIEAEINRYKTLRAAILNEKCPPSSPKPTYNYPPQPPQPPQQSCILEEINPRLFNLQKNIQTKQRNKENIENERKEFAEIKNRAEKNIAVSNCKQDLKDAYKNYCKNIEKLLNK